MVAANKVIEKRGRPKGGLLLATRKGVIEEDKGDTISNKEIIGKKVQIGGR